MNLILSLLRARGSAVSILFRLGLVLLLITVVIFAGFVLVKGSQPMGVVCSTVKIRVSAHIPLFLTAGDTLGLDSLTEVQAEATFRQEGW